MKAVKRASADFINSLWVRSLRFVSLYPALSFATLVVLVLGISSAILYGVEADQEHPLWRTVVYMLSGMDVDPPRTAVGEVTAVIVLICGVIIVSLLTGFVAAEFSRLLSQASSVALKSPRESFENHIVIFGWNAKTKAILRELDADFRRRGYRADDIVIVSEQERLERGQEAIYDHVWHVCGTATDSDVLRRADVPASATSTGAKLAVILGDTSLPPDEADRRSLLALLAVEHMHPPVISLADLAEEESASHFHNANADEVLVPSAYAGLLLARAAEYPGLASFVDELLALAPDMDAPAGRVPVSLYVKSADALGVTGCTLSEAVMKSYRSGQQLITGILGEHEAQLLPDCDSAARVLAGADQLVVIARPAAGGP